MLHALKEYAIQQGLTAEPGLKPKMVRWLLVFSPEGQFLHVQDLTGGDRKSKGREFPACPDLTQQEMISAGGGCRHFLVDGLDVVCLLTKDGEVDEKLDAKHDFFVTLLDQAKRMRAGTGPHRRRSLRDEADPGSDSRQVGEGKAKPTDVATLAVLDDHAVVDLRRTRRLACSGGRTYRGRMADRPQGQRHPRADARKQRPRPMQPRRMRCFLSGELVEPLPTHNKIEGLSDVGGLSMGDAWSASTRTRLPPMGWSRAPTRP